MILYSGPSQRTFKGKRIAERMGVVHNEEDQSLSIGDMKFVEEERPTEEDAEKKWRNGFRFRSSSAVKATKLSPSRSTRAD